MTDAPERIWAEQSGYFKKNGIYYNRGRWSDDEESGMAPFVRLDLHEAAVAAARADGMLEAARIAGAYADENRAMAQDAILLDPVMSSKRGDVLSLTDWQKSEELVVQGCVHSSMFHAAQNIAENIRKAAEASK